MPLVLGLIHACVNFIHKVKESTLPLVGLKVKAATPF